MECLRRRTLDGSACKGADETGSEEDGEDAEVLGGVVYGNPFVTRAEGVLDERAEVVRQWHVLGRCVNVGGGNEGAGAGASRGFGRDVFKGGTTMLRSPENVMVWALSAWVILSRLISK